jgi:hypothetical protein
MGIGRRAARIVLLTCVMLAATAGSALAANRFASPAGSGTACSQAAPCGIATAVNSAAANDNVTIEPGAYGSPGAPISSSLADNGHFLTIHGVVGQPRPVIYSDAMYGFSIYGGSELYNVELVDSAANAYGIWVQGGNAATITRVYIHTTGSGAWACYPDGELTDSVCWASGPGGGAARPLVVYSASVVAINDTFIASGAGSYGVEVIGQGTTTMAFFLTNSIIHGTTDDLHVTGFVPSGGTAKIVADHSDYATGEDDTTGSGTSMFTPAGTGTNLTAAPSFVNASTGNFHETASSPTIAQGTVDVVAGNTDLDGLPWSTSSPDMGAYQYYATPTCGSGTASTSFATPVQVNLHCSDTLMHPITYAIATGPAHGTLSAISTSGAVTYTPAAGFSGHDSFTYTGTSSLGKSAPTTVSITVGAEPKPMLSHLKHQKGFFSFTLNEAATVTFVFSQKRHGHTVRKGTVTINGTAGSNTFHFKGHLAKNKHLKRGRYTVTVTASNASGKSTPHQLRFKFSG